MSHIHSIAYVRYPRMDVSTATLGVMHAPCSSPRQFTSCTKLPRKLHGGRHVASVKQSRSDARRPCPAAVIMASSSVVMVTRTDRLLPSNRLDDVDESMRSAGHCDRARLLPVNFDWRCFCWVRCQLRVRQQCLLLVQCTHEDMGFTVMAGERRGVGWVWVGRRI